MKKAIRKRSPPGVPRTGFEPARCYPLPPQSSASANSATWAWNQLYVRDYTAFGGAVERGPDAEDESPKRPGPAGVLGVEVA